MILRFEVREAVRLDALLPLARPPSIDLEVLTPGQPTYCFSDADIEKKLILQQDFTRKFHREISPFLSTLCLWSVAIASF